MEERPSLKIQNADMVKLENSVLIYVSVNGNNLHEICDESNQNIPNLHILEKNSVENARQVLDMVEYKMVEH